MNLDPNDRAVVAHLRSGYEAADEATRSRLEAINEHALSDARQRRAQLLRELAAVDRAIAMREAWGRERG